MKIIDPNYTPPETTFSKYPDGNYKFKGFEWTSKTGEGNFCLRKQKNDKMTGRLKWFLEDGKQGPNQNLELSDMALLRKHYGLKEVNVPSQADAGAVHRYMDELQKASTSKTIEASVNDGWVNLKGLEVPKGIYRFYLSRVSDFQEGDYGKFFFVDFTVTAGEGGASTPYKGMTFTEIYNYAVKNVGGTPQWDITESGQPTAAAARLSTLIRLTAPDFASKDISPKDPNDIRPEWLEEALKVKKILKGARAEITNKNGSKRIGLVLQTLEPAYEDYQGSVETTPEPSTNSHSSGSTPKEILVKMMTDIMGSPAVVADQLTPAGKKFAGKYLVPLKDAGKLVNTTFMLLTDQEVYEIVKLVYQGDEELGIKENFLYEEDFLKVNELVNGIIKEEATEPAPWEEVEEVEENPFS